MEPEVGARRPDAMLTAFRFLARRLLFAGWVAIVIGGCALLPPGTVPAALDRPLVTFEASGGECPQGECGFRAEIFRDGRVTRTDGMRQSVDPGSLQRLVAAVESADYESILATPFAGECPRNYDGQEQIYTFHVSATPVIVASCTTFVDPAAEPFQTVQGILFGLGG